MRRGGFSLIELLVAIVIMGLLLAIALPAIQASRKAARSTQCRSHLKQIGAALHNYESIHGVFPPCVSDSGSWHVSILPFIDQTPLYNLVNTSASDPTAAINHIPIEIYFCPADAAPRVFKGDVDYAATSYLGNSGSGTSKLNYDGVFRHLETIFPQFPDGPVGFAEITDGASSTALVSEVLHSLGGNSTEAIRMVFNTPQRYPFEEREAFLAECASIPANAWQQGWRGSNLAHGWRWTQGSIGYSTYNHALPPMQPSCFNRSDVQTGIYTAASHHRSSVHVVYCDGHVGTVSPAVDAALWRQAGSRNDFETQDLFAAPDL
ncbi:DUF1559 domain-containing protein [Schlesneria sp. T3-172]|uniref:DUF1559 family PulG-like putative transporter n=1 Tax=Schlesneria sphaerica TaxID=3373610 RepID=UPI0037CC9875